MILIDPRAGSEGLLSPLQQMGYPAEMSRLDYGDVAFHGSGPAESEVSIGIEHKKLDDLLHCMQDERLMGHQVPGMLDQYDRCYLLLQGTPMLQEDGGFKSYEPTNHRWRRPHNTHLTLKRLFSYLIGVEEYGVKVVWVPSLGSSCAWIGALYSWWQVDYYKHQKVHVHTKPIQLITPTLRQRIASLLPGIGQGKLRDINAHWASARHMICAGAEDWEEIKGVGPKTAEGIQEALDERD